MRFFYEVVYHDYFYIDLNWLNSLKISGLEIIWNRSIFKFNIVYTLFIKYWINVLLLFTRKRLIVCLVLLYVNDNTKYMWPSSRLFFSCYFCVKNIYRVILIFKLNLNTWMSHKNDKCLKLLYNFTIRKNNGYIKKNRTRKDFFAGVCVWFNSTDPVLV